MSTHAIHHVTAVTSKIGANLSYYTGVLGLRLVKRSVNQDDVSAYHLFYADAVGSPGTDMTFFDWPTIEPNRPGPGTIALTTFRIPPGSMDFWEQRLSAAESPVERLDSSLRFADPEGQRLELVETADARGEGTPWTKQVPESYAIRGILGVDLESARPDATRQVVTQVLGYRESPSGTFTAEGESGLAHLRILGRTQDHLGRVGAGGVHHVAFRIADDAELREMQKRIEALGLRTSGFVDRFYFHSLYFREPGGILFELATDGPGFASDEDREHLGESLALPPFLEGRRSQIEAGLKPLPAV